MKTKLIACNMIRDEVELALAETGAALNVEWLEEGLHYNVNKLRGRMQEALDGSASYDRVLLAFGACGNMIDGLRVPGFELILPDADDCVTLMLYPHRGGKEAGTYYLTGGWVRLKRNAWNERADLTARFGEKKAARVMDQMFGGYHSLHLVNTGAYDLTEIEAESKENAASFDWAYDVEPGSIDWIKQLLTGPWDEKFLRFGPNETIDAGEVLMKEK
jgi:hypothetical protein